MAPSMLSPTQRYAAGALLALSLRQAQIRQTLHPGFDETPDGNSTCSIGGGSSEANGGLWTHESQGLVRPVLRYLEIDPNAWPGLEEAAASCTAENHIESSLRLLFEESGENSAEMSEQKFALTKAVDEMEMFLKDKASSVEKTSDDLGKCKQEMDKLGGDETLKISEAIQRRNLKNYHVKTEVFSQADELFQVTIPLQDSMKNNEEKVTVLYELLSACIIDSSQNQKEQSRLRKGYDARHRVALRLLATWLDSKWEKVEAMEVMVAYSAMVSAKEQVQEEEEENSSKSRSKWKRGGIIGAAAVTGGALLAITGGLAAPAIAAGFGALAPTLGTLLPVIGASGFAAIATATGTVAGSVAVAASFGAAGAGLSGSKMARRIGSVKEFELIPIGENHNQGRLAVAILISGFVFEKEDFVRPWTSSTSNLEKYALLWESKKLIAVSTAIQDWLKSSIAMGLMKQGAMMTVLGTLVAALAWPATLLSATDLIDSKWAVSIDRANKSGKILAELLLKGLHGNRPVTLVGFSLGARVVFKCLQHLAESGDNEGLIERVVLLGAPIALKSEPWESARRMVAGRFVNVYSTKDWILGVTFRASLLTHGLAGIQPVDVPGVENADVTDLIDGHSSYLWAAPKILDQLELDTYYSVFSPKS